MLPQARHIMMFSPLPPILNGIADYTYELLRLLGQVCVVTVVVDNGCRGARAPDGVRVLSLIEYEIEEHDGLETLHLYQVGNNPDHIYMLPVMARRPGLIVLHDASLHHLLDLVTVASGDISGYVHALQNEYGQPGRLLGEQFERHRIREQRIFSDLPMLHTLLGPALGVIVHSRFAAAKVLARLPDADVTVVPHHYSPPVPTQLQSRTEMRASLGIKSDEVLFLSLGFVTKAKLVAEALRALASVRDMLPPFRYLIAGELRPDEVDVLSLVKSLGLDKHVITLGYVAEEAFFSLIQASDVVINLRYPVGGETSGSMIRALGGGACIVVVDKGPFAELPDEAACKLIWGRDFVDRLAAVLLKLASQPALRQSIGAAARNLISKNNALQKTVDGYLEAIQRASNRGHRPWQCVAVWSELPPHELAVLSESTAHEHGCSMLPLWFAAHVLPLCDNPIRAVCWGARERDADLLMRLGHRPEFRPIEDLLNVTAWPDGRRTIDLAIVFAAADELQDDARLLNCLNNALLFQGLLVMSVRTGSGEAPHSLERRNRGAEMLARYGFGVQQTFVVAPPSLQTPTGSAYNGERCWRAVKLSEFVTDTMTDVLSQVGRAPTS